MLFRRKPPVILSINLEFVHYNVETMVHNEIKAGTPFPESIYDFFIDALGRELEATYSCAIFDCGVKAMEYFNLPSKYDTFRPNKAVDLRITKENVVCIPWHPARLPKALGNVRQNGYDRPESANCGAGNYYPELNLVVITTAHHHIAAARAYHDQNISIKAAVISLEPMFRDLRISPALQWQTARPSMEHLTPDPRFCLMYELARRKALLLKSPADFQSEPETAVCFHTTLQVVPIEYGALSWWRKILLRCTNLYIEPGAFYRQNK